MSRFEQTTTLIKEIIWDLLSKKSSRLTQESKPKEYNIKKKLIAKKFAYGNRAIASGYMTNASPGPL